MSICNNNVICPDGNCMGCKNGNSWCKDPKCYPYCPGCSMPEEIDFNGNMVLIVILVCLIAILFIVWFVYGPVLFEHHNDHERARVIVPVSDK